MTTERVIVLHFIGDTVVEEEFTAERITWQRYPHGRMQLKLWRNGEIAQYVSYERVARAHRIIGDLALVPREERP